MADNNIDSPIIPILSDVNFFRAQKKLVIILDNTENREDVKFDNGVDIKRSIKIELIDYTANQTVLAQNQFPVAPNNGDAGSVSLTDGEGNPAQLIEPARNNQRVYIDSVAPNAKAAFNETSATRQLNTDVDGPFLIKKGKLSSTAPTGDDIYRSIDSQRENSEFVQRVQRVLIDNTHYNANEPFIPNPGNMNENNIRLATVSYNTLGLYGPKKYPVATSDITENNRINLKEMKRLGILTLLAGSGDIINSYPDDKSDSAWFGETFATSLVPGLGRLGVKFPTSRFDANQVVKSMKPDFIRPTNTQFLDGKTNYTYGNTNTPFAPFSGVTAVASIASATILVATVGGLLFAFSQIRYRKQAPRTHSKNSKESRYGYLGSSDGSAGDKFDFPLFDVPKLRHDFFACLNEGIKVFFGFETSPGASLGVGALQVLGGASEKILNAHGYFNTILRQIVRGTSDLIGGIGAAFGAGQGANFEPRADEIFSQLDPGAILERLRGQPIVKFINILVTIGDRMIDREGTIQAGASIEDTISIIDSIAGEMLEDKTIDPGILIAKNRLDDFNGRSAMANRNKRALLSMPYDLADSARLLGNTNTADPATAFTTLALNNKIVTQNRVQQNNQTIIQNRIDAETVREFEDYLEKDYMPFYFQDLRTNEILSFHAFLGDLNESLNADYTETEGYGRIGTVPIYKNTKRNIGFSFYVVSTSEEDFDEMWFKINRLAMMLFPQWSEGRRVDFANVNKFVQPFSQVPAASPLIRFRIGDLWKANYSKFAVARLFGLSSDVNQFKIGSMQNVPSTINEPQIQARAVEIENRRVRDGVYELGDIIRVDRRGISSGNGGTKLYKITDSAAAAPTGGQRASRNNPNVFGVLNSGGIGGSPSVSFDYSTTEWLNPAENTELTVQNIVNGSRENGNSNVYLIVTVSAPAGARLRRMINGSNGGRREDTSQAPSGESFVVPMHLATNPGDLIRRAAVRAVLNTAPGPANPNENQNQQNNATIVQNFFADEGSNANPIMKAFKSTEGRGMAGFIKTMTFDYAQSTWETEKFGGRAPKFLKIQIEFLPIWDVYPGLDYKGAMTAPVWNVGKIMNAYHGGNGLTTTARNNFDQSKQKLLKF